MNKYVVILILFSFELIFAQNRIDEKLIKNDETNAVIPSLDKFHKIIVAIFHDYIPKKDYESMKNALPTIQNNLKEINDAKLPERLYEKYEKWNKQKDTLSCIVSEYTEAVFYNDDEKLLEVAKKIHLQYEKMIRFIKPKAKYLDSLHILFHEIKKIINNDANQEELKRFIPRLMLCKDSVVAIHFKYRGRADNIELKRKSEEKIFAFETQRHELETDINNFILLLNSQDKGNICKSFEIMHNKYHLCDSTLE